MTHSATPRGRFDLRTANEYFGGWVTAAPSDELVIPMAFPVEGWAGSAAVLVRQDGDGVVHGEVIGAGGDDAAAWRQALAVLSLDVDGAGFDGVGKRDRVIGELQHRFGGLRPVLFHSPYEAACAFVIGHRITIAQGRAIRRRLAEEHGTAIDTPAGTQHAFPSPQALLQLDAFAGVPASKWPRLHAICEAALTGRLDRERLRSLPVEDALRELRTIPGLGPFFSQGVLYRGAGLVDVVSDDEMTKLAVQRAYGLQETPDHAEVARIAEAWRPYRMWVSVLLHVALRRDDPPRRGHTRARGRRQRPE